MSAIELQIGGFGGQGVILAGVTIGRGLALYDGYHVSLTQSFGPEARGSACSVQLMISPEPVLYPYVNRPHILIVLSQEAYRRFAPRLRPGGRLIIEEDLVCPEEFPDAPCPAGETGVGLHRVPAMRLADELGRRMAMNMVLVGFFTGIMGMLTLESGRRAVSESVPRGTEALNLAAFDKGYAYALAQTNVVSAAEARKNSGGTPEIRLIL